MPGPMAFSAGLFAPLCKKICNIGSQQEQEASCAQVRYAWTASLTAKRKCFSSSQPLRMLRPSNLPHSNTPPTHALDHARCPQMLQQATDIVHRPERRAMPSVDLQVTSRSTLTTGCIMCNNSINRLQQSIIIALIEIYQTHPHKGHM